MLQHEANREIVEKGLIGQHLSVRVPAVWRFKCEFCMLVLGSAFLDSFGLGFRTTSGFKANIYRFMLVLLTTL